MQANESKGRNVRHVTRAETKYVVGFGVANRDGREIGALVRRAQVEIVLDDDQTPRQWWRETESQPVGTTYYTITVRATRDGMGYGCATPHTFATAAQLDAWLEKYLAGARRRAAAKVRGGVS